VHRHVVQFAGGERLKIGLGVHDWTLPAADPAAAPALAQRSGASAARTTRITEVTIGSSNSPSDVSGRAAR